MRRVLSSAVLLAAAAFPVLADERMEHAEWVSAFREGTGEASTKESGMTSFGMQCSEESCRFFYENGTNCEPGATYPMVIATSAGSIGVETVCEPVTKAEGEASRYWFADSPQFNDALMQSDTVGIAFPLSSGQFKISQFLMNGYGEAIERVAAGLRARKAEREARELAEREQRAREAAERARKAQEAAERAKQAAEQAAAERARKAAEQEAAERERRASEAAERARIAAENEAAERAAQEAARQKAATEAVPAPDEAVKPAETSAEPVVSSPQEPAVGAAAPSEPSEPSEPSDAGEPSEAQPADTDGQPRPQESPRGKRIPATL